jgi:hypothetical protein
MYSSFTNFEIFAATWNRLDISILAPRLSEEFIYKSQFVFNEIHSKSQFLKHLEAKFKVIQLLIDWGKMKVEAELAYHPDLENRPCIILTQTELDKNEKVIVIIEEKESLIISIEVCFQPDPNDATGLGIYPL